ncbi:MAG: hypothetical protein ACOZFS_03340 [Thermodesulfobacteriota bacterium]
MTLSDEVKGMLSKARRFMESAEAGGEKTFPTALPAGGSAPYAD